MDNTPSLADDLANLATALLAPRPWWQRLIPPAGQAERLRYLAGRVRKLERALDDIAADAMEDERQAFDLQEAKERAIQRGQITQLVRTASRHMTGGTAA